MISLFTFCDIPWWLTWLLPFLLGLGLGYLLWSKYKDMVADMEAKIKALNLKIVGLDAELEACRKARMESEGNISMLKGRLRELEMEKTNTINENLSSVKLGLSQNDLSQTTAAADSNINVAVDPWFEAIGTDKLQIIEGIGPKMEEVLHENGIKSFSQLSNKSGDSLRDILSKYGDKYRIIDPNTWPKQALLADQRAWNDLIALQKTLDTGRSDTATVGETDSKLEKWLIKAGILRRWSQDDLKAVEGIGPKIEGLLHAADIKTWRALSETPVAKIQEVLTAAGSRFALADPGTWPEQAGMAADGKWDELQKYQDFLNAGKAKK
jgi:predicted flap endonuclease-1-like 5' DNA nuclease